MVISLQGCFALLRKIKEQKTNKVAWESVYLEAGQLKCGAGKDISLQSAAGLNSVPRGVTGMTTVALKWERVCTVSKKAHFMYTCFKIRFY